jgi:hypothetical protein
VAALGRIASRAVVVAGEGINRGRAVRIWAADTGEPIGAALITGYSDIVNTLAVNRVDGRDLVHAAFSDRLLAWDAATGEPAGERRKASDAWWMDPMVLGRVGGRDVVVSGRAGPPRRPDGPVRDYTICVWDADTGELIGEPLTGHTDRIQALAIGRVGGRDVIVSGADDQIDLGGYHVRVEPTVRIWDVAASRPVGEPLRGHTGNVTAVALGRIGSRDVLVSAGDHAICVWDATTGEPIGAPLTGHTGPICAVAVTQFAGRELIISGSRDQTVRIWDPTGEPTIVIDLPQPARLMLVDPGSDRLYAIGSNTICAFTA